MNVAEQPPIRIAVAGALGRMGRTVTSVVADEPSLVLAARFDLPEATEPGLVSRDAALAQADVVIDFTRPEASLELAALAAERGRPALVIGATGWSADQKARLDAESKSIPIVCAGNFSLGLNLLLGLVAQAARALPAREWDIEVFEAHHRHKTDAPSGTALMLGEAAARARGVEPSQVAGWPRTEAAGPRRCGEIGFSAARAGGLIGEHSVLLAATDEIVTLSHSARDRTLFARGAVQAARWAARRSPGVYDMQDVLGLSQRPT